MVTDYVSDAYTAHHDHLRRYLTAFTHDHELAEDVAHDAYARLAVEVRRSRAPQEMRAWLFKVGRNLAIDRGRRQQIALKAQERLPAGGVEPSAEAECLVREDRRELGRILARLSPLDRRALQMSAEGYSGAEIARAVGMTEGALRTRMCRARARLRSLVSLDS